MKHNLYETIIFTLVEARIYILTKNKHNNKKVFVKRTIMLGWCKMQKKKKSLQKPIHEHPVAGDYFRVNFISIDTNR